MRILKRALVALGVLSVAFATTTIPQAAAAPGDNLVPAQTSDLEGSGTGLWTPWFGGSIARSTAQSFTGAASLAISASDQFVGVNWSNWPGVTGVQDETEYTLSYAVHGPTGTTFTAEFEWLNINTSLRTDIVSAATNGGWAEVSETVTAPAGADRLFLSVRSNNASSGTTYYLDTVKAVEGTGGPPPPPPPTCTDPVWSSSEPGALYTGDPPYLVDNNMWNAEGYNITQTTSVCDHASWFTDVTVPGPTDTAVKTYPNVHQDWHDWSTGEEPPISSFNSITSSFAGEWTGGGVYDIAYDIWINGVGNGPGVTELMIWTENSGQRPAGSQVGTVTVDGRDWQFWATSGDEIVSFVATSTLSSAELDLKAFMQYLMDTGRLASDSTLGQIGYGVEVVSTGGGSARFDVTDFSISTS